jgi:membrane-associated PAP2 superfamily phosphatase
MQPGQVIEAINPLQHVGEDQYAAIWQKLFVTLLAGFWGRAAFIAFAFMAIFFGLRRRNPRAAVIFVLLAAVVAYGAGVLDALKNMKII